MEVNFISIGDAKIPTRVYGTDVGYDLFSAVDDIIEPNEQRTISTGIIASINTDYFFRIAERSGNASKLRLRVGAGIIEPTYRGIIHVVLYNHSNKPYIVRKNGDAIAQLIIHRRYIPDRVNTYSLNTYDESKVNSILGGTERGANGFGHSNLSDDTINNEVDRIINSITSINPIELSNGNHIIRISLHSHHIYTLESHDSTTVYSRDSIKGILIQYIKAGYQIHHPKEDSNRLVPIENIEESTEEVDNIIDALLEVNSSITIIHPISKDSIIFTHTNQDVYSIKRDTTINMVNFSLLLGTISSSVDRGYIIKEVRD